jgi:hypothetical protein
MYDTCDEMHMVGQRTASSIGVCDSSRSNVKRIESMSKSLRLFLVLAFVLGGISAITPETASISAQAPTPIAVDCPDAPPARLTPGFSALVVSGKTAELRSAPDTTSDRVASIQPYYSLPVTGEPVCAESLVWWPVDYYDFEHENQYYSGWIAESDQQDYVLQPQPSDAIDFTVPEDQDSITVRYGGISFEYNGALGRTVHAITRHAEKVSPGSGLPDSGEHVLFTFEDPGVEPRSRTPVLAVYLVEDPPTLNSRAREQAELIQALLEQKPAPETLRRYMFESEPAEFPLEIYPPVFEGQWFRTRHQYLTFQAGAGIRFVAMYARATPPTTNDGLIYSVQAVSDDGKYLVSVVFPVTFGDIAESDALLAATNNLPFEQYQQNVQEYGEEVTEKMDQAAPADFTPSLDSLDQFITSLQFGEDAP